MTDKTYTRQELEEMADQLLTADDKKKAEKTADKKPESAKINDKTLEEKLGKCPAAALLAGNEKLRRAVHQGQEEGPPGAGGAVRGGGRHGLGRRPDGQHL